MDYEAKGYLSGTFVVFGVLILLYTLVTGNYYGSLIGGAAFAVGVLIFPKKKMP